MVGSQLAKKYTHTFTHISSMDILTYLKAISDCYGSFWVVRLGVISGFSFIVFYIL